MNSYERGKAVGEAFARLPWPIQLITVAGAIWFITTAYLSHQEFYKGWQSVQVEQGYTIEIVNPCLPEPEVLTVEHISYISGKPDVLFARYHGVTTEFRGGKRFQYGECTFLEFDYVTSAASGSETKQAVFGYPPTSQIQVYRAR